jgi:hypothetical protein
MKNHIARIIIDRFMSDSKYQFQDFDMNEVLTELEPLIQSTIDNYLYLKKTNPNNIKVFNAQFIQPTHPLT